MLLCRRHDDDAILYLHSIFLVLSFEQSFLPISSSFHALFLPNAEASTTDPAGGPISSSLHLRYGVNQILVSRNPSLLHLSLYRPCSYG
jgi:hypothetical protein